jgi:hypothetical protein
MQFSEGKAAPPSAVPAFRFTEWKENTIAKLPDPAVPFGLDFVNTRMIDAGLKEP